MIKVLKTFTAYGVEYPIGSEIKPGTFEADDLGHYLDIGLVVDGSQKKKPAESKPLKESDK